MGADATKAGTPGLASETWETTEIPDEDFARLYFRVHDAAQQLVLDQQTPRLPQLLRTPHRPGLPLLRRIPSRSRRPRSGHGRPPRRHQHRRARSSPSSPTSPSTTRSGSARPSTSSPAKKPASSAPTARSSPSPSTPKPTRPSAKSPPRSNVRGVSATSTCPKSAPVPTIPTHRSPGHSKSSSIPPSKAPTSTATSPWPSPPPSNSPKTTLPHHPRLHRTRHPQHPLARPPRANHPPQPTRIHPRRSPQPRRSLGPARRPKHFQPENPGAPGLASETWDHICPGRPSPMIEATSFSGLTPPKAFGHAQCLIFACLRDKPLREMTQILFPIFDHVVLAPIHSPRATEVADLLAAAEATGVPIHPLRHRRRSHPDRPRSPSRPNRHQRQRLPRRRSPPHPPRRTNGREPKGSPARRFPQVRPNPLPLSARRAATSSTPRHSSCPQPSSAASRSLASLFDKHGRTPAPHRPHLGQRLRLFSGSKLQVIGIENIPAHAAVFAANHTSYMDTPVVFASLPFQFRILAKKELWSLPFIGWYLDRSGQIPIDTANPRTTLSSFAAGVKTLRQGLSVFVFPEGGRTPTAISRPSSTAPPSSPSAPRSRSSPSPSSASTICCPSTPATSISPTSP